MEDHEGAQGFEDAEINPIMVEMQQYHRSVNVA